jgi:propionyl-CoA carboxylase alpha chain
MRAAGVPTLPSVTVEGDALPDIVAVESLGWPLLVKASSGGGGRGMRIVWGPSELADAVAGARREAEAAFGDGAVFLEQYLREPRHIEVQVLADAYGETVALFERECSIQRRHQKIVEEAPSPAVTPELRAHMVDASVTAAREIGYVNAGTVEFVVDGDGEPFFLEMNTRLQVEHPVTEAITGLDLVRLQLLIAGGAPMPPEVQVALSAGPRGHAIEARLYAEDPALGWMPSTGTLHRFEIDTRVGEIAVRVDSGVESGSEVSPHYDSMLAKVITHAPTRREAATALAATLAGARIHGVTTNRDLLVHIVRHPGFLAGDTDTGFLDRHGIDRLATPLADLDAVRRHALAAALAGQARRRTDTGVQPTIPSGFRNNASSLQQTTYDVGGRSVMVGYRFDRFGHQLEEVEIDGSNVDIDAVAVAPDRVSLTVGGLTRHYRVEQVASNAYVDGSDGSSTLVERPRFPVAGDHIAEGSALAPMPGGVVRVAVAEGQTVSAGQLLVVLEAMKMEHAVHSSAAGTVTEVTVSEGDQVETGQILVVVEGEPGGGGVGPVGASREEPADGTRSPAGAESASGGAESAAAGDSDSGGAESAGGADRAAGGANSAAGGADPAAGSESAAGAESAGGAESAADGAIGPRHGGAGAS